MSEKEKSRIDKWLWAVRLFKTRSLASEACKSGKVKISGKSVKPSHVVKVSEEISIQKGGSKKVVRVKDLLERRVDAATAALFFEDITPPEENPAFPSAFHTPVFKRNRGAGRPTKKERREMDQVRSNDNF
ncbi:heat shock protein Hsp15 [Anseongella ginsenosidimutans]|uniref:Heat shock protein Hsp15 n=1 Tax=Anseongella ginsenosidimutans TaxID=496056 RepID=A0A4R3KQ57_9SPHI|nr:RNA-binding S4 domain-containing protein [Anseongella ginsenosidimutans]QEC52341.1 RNA-binding S4 domain-containing protein [Anseongella ginsenosidimutans]TCS86908.1 heat shock protein Hsp15 [Anseongella ginsenosidimutans]